MNYQKIYDSICQKTISENRKKGEGVYYEKHHIIPKCLGGSNTKDNLVLLTPKEHYICHLILYYLYPNSIGLALAYTKFNSIHKKGANQFSKIRYSAVQKISGENNPMFGKTHSNEVKQKISLIHKGKVISEQTKLLWKKSNRGSHWLGKKHKKETIEKMKIPKSDEQKQKLKESAKKRPIKICPHCLFSSTTNMERWHFDNCKNKP